MIADVHVWDNASSDRTPALLDACAAAWPWLHVYRSSVNVHHGPALDALLRDCCRSEWVLLLDADTEVRRSFGAALAGIDVGDAVFVGQIHPQMPHLYAYLAHLLVHRARYRELPAFRHHGAPGVDFFRFVEHERRPFVRFRWCDYVHHFGQGSLRRIARDGQREHEFYEFARNEERLKPSTPERIAHERALAATAPDLARRSSGGKRGGKQCAARRSGRVARFRCCRRRRTARSGAEWLDEAGTWIRSPRLAGRLRAARRMGLVQKSVEAFALARMVERLRPRGVLEVGTAHGGSFLLWARSAAPDAALVSVDAPPWELDDPSEADKRQALQRVASGGQSVTVIRGNSHDPAVRRRAGDCFRERGVDFLFIDGDHSRAGVEADFRDYAPLVRPGGIVALHDIHPHSQGWGGEVPGFWREIRDRYRHTELIADPRQDGFGIGVIWV